MLFDRAMGSDSQPDAIWALHRQLNTLADQVDQTKILAAQPMVREFRSLKNPIALGRAEFRVFSQFGDDGIIQYIISRLSLAKSDRRFIEFGVENYRESNTRFLLLNDNWTGLVMDGREDNVASIRSEALYWRNDVTALARFITRDNINAILQEAGFFGRLGILSVDVDGNDYWIWEAITVVDPAVVIVEFNGIFGSREAVTIPYQADFVREKAHYSFLYWGTSLKALCFLAGQKGYVWIGCNNAGNNAYFVRSEYAEAFCQPSLPEDFVQAKFREARDQAGKLGYVGQEKGFELIKDLPVWDVVERKMRVVGDLSR